MTFAIEARRSSSGEQVEDCAVSFRRRILGADSYVSLGPLRELSRRYVAGRRIQRHSHTGFYNGTVDRPSLEHR